MAPLLTRLTSHVGKTRRPSKNKPSAVLGDSIVGKWVAVIQSGIVIVPAITGPTPRWVVEIGIELYLQGYWSEGDPPFRRVDVLRAFGKEPDEAPDRGFYALRYDETNRCDLSLTETDGLVTVICIVKPCAHSDLYRGLFQCLRLAPFVLFAPGGLAPVVARDDVVDRLPKDMIEALGKPVVVAESDLILTALFGKA